MILGTYKREYPRGYVMRGWDPQNPTTLSSALPVVKDTEGMPDEIQPGMIISTNAEGNAWKLGAPESDNALIAFAQDGVERWDVMASGSLVGLLCSGKFRFATPFFARYKKATSTVVLDTDGKTIKSYNPSAVAAEYKAGTPLTYCGDTEVEYPLTAVNVNNGNLVNEKRELKGFIRPAEAGETVIGYVAETHSGTNRAASYTDVVPARADQISIGKAVDSTSKFTNAYMVIWDSSLAPSAPTA
jgi:hypothetical protein